MTVLDLCFWPNERHPILNRLALIGLNFNQLTIGYINDTNLSSKMYKHKLFRMAVFLLCFGSDTRAKSCSTGYEHIYWSINVYPSSTYVLDKHRLDVKNGFNNFLTFCLRFIGCSPFPSLNLFSFAPPVKWWLLALSWSR